MALRPQIMLFDEVTSALDPQLVGEVLNVLRKIATESEKTMLIVIHEMNFAQEIADRIIFMAEGKIVEDNTPEIIFSRPKQKRTQEFLRTIL